MAILLATIIYVCIWLAVSSWAVLTGASTGMAFAVAAVCGALATLWLLKLEIDDD